MDFASAESADCDPGFIPQSEWKASELRYFDDDPALKYTYLLLCVTELHTASEAQENETKVASLSPGVKAQIGVSGSSAHRVGAAP